MALTKKEKKVSLNIKISEPLDLRLKRAREAARASGMMFNVSKEVEAFLEKELKKVEKNLLITQDVHEQNAQLDMLIEDKDESPPS